MSLYDEYIEPLRRNLFHKLGLVAEVSPEQYSLTYRGTPEEAEEVLSDMGFVRNPIAWLKMHNIFGVSEGSWAKRESLFSDMQLHVTLQRDTTEKDKTHVFAHWEKNWIRHPTNHILEIGFDDDEGVSRVKNLFKSHVNNEKIYIKKDDVPE